MIPYPVALKAVGGARTGIAPANLLDVQDINGNIYRWADRVIDAPFAISGAIPPYSSLVPPVTIPAGQQVAWTVPTAVAVVQGIPLGITTTASATPRGGRLTQIDGDAFGTGADIVWSGFATPALPAGAVIESIYAVALMTRGAGNSFVGGSFGSSIPAAFASGQFSNALAGTLAGALAAGIGVSMAETLSGARPDFLTLTDVAIAVYYSLPGETIGGGGYTNPGEAPYGSGPYLPWLLSIPQFSFHRSMQTDMGNFVIQNLSGDTLSRDMEKILRSSTLEGAMFVYRCWQPDAEAAWIEVHGQLTLGEDGVDTVELKAADLINAAQDDTPLEISCETCQLNWALARCGATGPTECQYSYQTCQVPEKIMVVLNNFEKNYGESTANIAVRPINRARKF